MKCCMGVLHAALQGILHEVLQAAVHEVVHEGCHAVLHSVNNAVLHDVNYDMTHFTIVQSIQSRRGWRPGGIEPTFCCMSCCNSCSII